jgi:arylsulfatase
MIADFSGRFNLILLFLKKTNIMKPKFGCKIFFVFFLIVFSGCKSPESGEYSKTSKPNIVLIMADDMGYSDIGCYGGEVATPHIDRLAGEGLRFTSFYNAARCCPTRASLLTGIYPHEAGMGGMVNPSGKMAENVAYQGFLNEECVTIAEVLKEAGYYTAMSGKWHVGEERPHWPVDRGFENYFGLISGAMNYWDISRTKSPGIKRHFAIDSTEYLPPNNGFYMTDAVTENAVSYLQNANEKKQPFFLYVAYTAPHWPLHAHPEDIAKYRGKFMAGWDSLREARMERMLKMRLIDEHTKLSPRDEEVKRWASLSDAQKEEMDLLMAIYAAQIDRMDQGIGQILDQLDAMEAAENTLVLFLSDNGACHEGGIWGQQFWEEQGEPGTADSYLSYGKSWANLSNTPYREYKHWVHEGGIKTPLIARWPAAIPDKGGLTPQVGHITDLMATCVEIAGAEYPATFNGKQVKPLRGKSLLPVFKGDVRNPHQVLFWEHLGNRAAREANWKIVGKKGQPWELYNLDNDATELNDLSGDSVHILQKMAAKYDEWAESANVIHYPFK